MNSTGTLTIVSVMFLLCDNIHNTMRESGYATYLGKARSKELEIARAFL